MLPIRFIIDKYCGTVARRVQTAWLCLGLLVERPWLALEGPFMSFLAKMDLRRNDCLTLKGLHFSYASLAKSVLSTGMRSGQCTFGSMQFQPNQLNEINGESVSAWEKKKEMENLNIKN